MAAKEISVVLVHGAWADGSSWSKVISRLVAQGANVIAAPIPLTTLDDDVAAVNRTLDRINGPVVLVGHAYAGAVIGATRHTAVKSLVYVAALAPAEGETVADIFYRGTPHPSAPKLAPERDGFIWLPQSAFATAFAPNATVEEQAILGAIQRPISAACISVKVGRPLWKDVPTWYLLAQNDRMIVRDNQHFMAERMTAKVRAIDADHAPSVTAPDEVVRTILDAVEATRSL
ncbi:MAG TPA: alpha/beta hydrolase [Steroidobacteraceae bacterium]|nr:alpha/beta hydrolase [Steroidobacteraceae bacterium]